MNNINNEASTSPANPAPLMEISEDYYDHSEVHRRPAMRFRLTPDYPATDTDTEADGTINYDRKTGDCFVGGVGMPLDQQLEYSFAMGERAALKVTYDGEGLVDIYFGEHEDMQEADGASVSDHKFLLLGAFLAGMDSLIGPSATIDVLHLDMLDFILRCGQDHLRRGARRDPNGAEGVAYREGCARIEAMSPNVAQAILRLDAAGKRIGTAEEHSAAKAWALSVLIG